MTLIIDLLACSFIKAEAAMLLSKAALTDGKLPVIEVNSFFYITKIIHLYAIILLHEVSCAFKKVQGPCL